MQNEENKCQLICKNNFLRLTNEEAATRYGPQDFIGQLSLSFFFLAIFVFIFLLALNLKFAGTGRTPKGGGKFCSLDVKKNTAANKAISQWHWEF